MRWRLGAARRLASLGPEPVCSARTPSQRPHKPLPEALSTLRRRAESSILPHSCQAKFYLRQQWLIHSFILRLKIPVLTLPSPSWGRGSVGFPGGGPVTHLLLLRAPVFRAPDDLPSLSPRALGSGHPRAELTPAQFTTWVTDTTRGKADPEGASQKGVNRERRRETNTVRTWCAKRPAGMSQSSKFTL